MIAEKKKNTSDFTSYRFFKTKTLSENADEKSLKTGTSLPQNKAIS